MGFCGSLESPQRRPRNRWNCRSGLPQEQGVRRGSRLPGHVIIIGFVDSLHELVLQNGDRLENESNGDPLVLIECGCCFSQEFTRVSQRQAFCFRGKRLRIWCAGRGWFSLLGRDGYWLGCRSCYARECAGWRNVRSQFAPFLRDEPTDRGEYRYDEKPSAHERFLVSNHYPPLVRLHLDRRCRTH